MVLITILTVILLETVRNKLIIVRDFVDDHSKALDTLFNKLQQHNSHCGISSVATGKLPSTLLVIHSRASVLDQQLNRLGTY